MAKYEDAWMCNFAIHAIIAREIVVYLVALYETQKKTLPLAYIKKKYYLCSAKVFDKKH